MYGLADADHLGARERVHGGQLPVFRLPRIIPGNLREISGKGFSDRNSADFSSFVVYAFFSDPYMHRLFVPRATRIFPGSVADFSSLVLHAFFSDPCMQHFHPLFFLRRQSQSDVPP